MGLNAALNRAWYLTDGTIDFDRSWYDELVGEKIFPAYIQKTSSALDCFKANAEAFCSRDNNGNYVCDLSDMGDYTVKEGQLKYGGNIVLNDSKAQVISVTGESPDSPNFSKELNRFLASFAVHVIVERHATMVHLAISQRITMEVTRPIYADIYTKNPAIQHLIQVLTTRVNEVSLNEQLLIGPDYSLVSRAASFTNESLFDFCKSKYDKYSSLTSEAILELLLPCEGAFKQSGMKAYSAAQALVKGICEEHMPDNIINKLGLMLWNSSFYHYYIGDYQIHNLIYGQLTLTCTGEDHVQNQKYATLATTIAVTTMTRTLNLVDIVELTKENEGKKYWRQYGEVMNGIETTLPDFSLKISYPAVNF